MAPGAVSHESHDSASAVFAPAVILYRLCMGCKRRFESRAVAPGAETPFGQNAPVAVGANMAKGGGFIEAVPIAAAPGADKHTFTYRLGAL